MPKERRQMIKAFGADLDFLKEELQALKDSGLYNEIRIVESAQGAWLVVDGVCVLNLCSNNYLYIEG